MAQATQETTRRSAIAEGHYAVTELEFMHLTLMRDALNGMAELAFDGAIERATETSEITRRNLSALMTVLSDRLGATLDALPFVNGRRA